MKRAESEDGGGSASEIAEELEFHVRGVTGELVSAGWEPGAARLEAQRRFGDVSRIRMECMEIGRSEQRRERRASFLRGAVQDARHAVRSLARSPGFTLMAILTLGLGIGSTTAIFAVVDGVLLRPLPLGSPERLYLVYERNLEQGIERDRPSGPNYVDWRESSRTISGMTAIRDDTKTLTGRDRAEVLDVAGVTADFLSVLGVSPMVGRGFAVGDDEGAGRRVVLLSHSAWTRLFDGDPTALGRSMTLDGEPYEVIGVMPAGFQVPRKDVSAWIPYDPRLDHRQTRYLTVIARLADGVPPRQAETELQAIGSRLSGMYPEANRGFVPYLVGVRDQMVGPARAILLVVFGAVGFVFLLACTNVASLVLGRSMARESEMAVRSALGATPGRIARQLITENLMLGGLGGAAGALVAYTGLRVFTVTLTRAVPRGDQLSIDPRILGFALLVSVIAGLALALAPSLRARGSSRHGIALTNTRVAGGRRGALGRRLLIVAEVTMSVVLLVGAGLALRSFVNLRSIDPGYATENIVMARVDLSGPRYDSGTILRRNALKARYFESLLERIRAVPGVLNAGLTTTLPLRPSGIDFDLAYRAEGQPDLPESDLPQVDYRIISAGYLDAMGIRIEAGRDVSDEDRAGARPVLLLNEEFATQLWPGQDPIGKRIRIYYIADTEWEVAGVVANTRHRGLAESPRAQVFVPVGQAELLFGYMTVVARTAGPVQGVGDAMRDAAAAVDPDEPLFDFDSIETVLADATQSDRLAAQVFGAFAAIALLLAAAGIHGVISYQVTRQTREIGVRIALGAGRVRVLLTVVGEVVALVSTGLLVGLIVAAAGARTATGFLFGVGILDAATLIGVSTLLLCVAILAALVPALRAASIPPTRALTEY